MNHFGYNNNTEKKEETAPVQAEPTSRVAKKRAQIVAKIKRAEEKRREEQRKERELLAALEEDENKEIVAIVRKAITDKKHLGDIDKAIKDIFK
jgi:methylmalonyl-CoA mutase N-terminal domain/subunit